MQAFLGKILSVQPEKGIMQVEVLESSSQPQGGKRLTRITLNYDQDAVTEILSKDTYIRFWGALNPKSGVISNVEAIRSFKPGRTDSTGVRSRLKMGRSTGFTGRSRRRGKH